MIYLLTPAWLFLFTANVFGQNYAIVERSKSQGGILSKAYDLKVRGSLFVLLTTESGSAHYLVGPYLEHHYR